MIENFDIFKDDRQNCYQLRTKTNAYVLEFDDKEREYIFLEIASHLKQNNDLTLKDLRGKLQSKTNESKVIDVLKALDEYRLLPFEISREITDTKESSDNQYSSDVKQTSDFVLSIFGQGKLTEKIEKQTSIENFKNVKSHLFSDKLDTEKEVSNSDFLIVDANEWSPYYIELINELALKYNKPWLYVGGIEETSIKIGPLFYGKETGCYNCLIRRIKSNHDNPTFLNSYENYLKYNKKSAKPDIIPNSGIIYNIVANLALLEVMKFIEAWSLPVTWRCVLNLNIISLDLRKHNLLKIPFCEVCKPKLEYNPAPWLEAITLK
ncbi:MAG: TOMM precursor leader peptide-binding protein [Bacteroidales bacterium]